MPDLYADYFGTDWETITDREELLARAYALGVAESLGENYPTELSRLQQCLDSGYEQSIVELAYNEGRHEAGESEADDPEETFDELTDASVTIDPSSADRPQGIPDALTRQEIESKQTDRPTSIDRPGFLTREEADEKADQNRPFERLQAGESLTIEFPSLLEDE